MLMLHCSNTVQVHVRLVFVPEFADFAQRHSGRAKGRRRPVNKGRWLDGHSIRSALTVHGERKLSNDNFLLLLCDCRAHDGNGLPMCPWEEQSRLAHSDGTYQSHEFALVATPGTDATLVSTASS